MNAKPVTSEREIVAALYLYCLGEGRIVGPMSLKGIDGEGKVFILPFGEWQATVSEVSVEDFTSNEIQRKALEDLAWIKEKALVHAEIIQEAMTRDGANRAIIPMKFGTIFDGPSGLEKVLEQNYARIERVFEKIRGRQEWAVKVYLEDRKAFEEKVKEKSDFVKEKQREIASLPEGMAYFAEEELQNLLSIEIDRELAEISNSLHESLEKKADISGRCKLLGKEFTGKSAPMILNGAYLFSKERIEDFKKEVETLSEDAKGQGLSVEYSGPWPPYNFATW